MNLNLMSWLKDQTGRSTKMLVKNNCDLIKLSG